MGCCQTRKVPAAFVAAWAYTASTASSITHRCSPFWRIALDFLRGVCSAVGTVNPRGTSSSLTARPTLYHRRQHCVCVPGRWSAWRLAAVAVTVRPNSATRTWCCAMCAKVKCPPSALVTAIVSPSRPILGPLTLKRRQGCGDEGRLPTGDRCWRHVYRRGAHLRFDRRGPSRQSPNDTIRTGEGLPRR